jgi:hypothetical protein
MAQDKGAAPAESISSRSEEEAAGDFEKIEGLLPDDEDEDGAVVEGADDEDPDGLYDDEAEEGDDGEEDEDADDDEADDEDVDSDSGAEPTITIEEDGKKVKLTAKEVRESRLRHADYTRKTMALADQRKEAEAKAAAADEHVKVYGGLVTEYRKHLDTILRNEPDWDKLKADDPQQYLLVKEEWRAAQAERDAAKAEEERLAGEERGKQEKALAAHLDAETVKLLEALPAWKKDKAVAQREALAIRNFLRRRGLNDQEMTTVLSDHRSVLIVRDAALFDQAQRKGKTKIRPAKPARKVLRPGSTNTPAATGDRSTSRSQQHKRLRETGHVRDAASVFERIPGLFDGKK